MAPRGVSALAALLILAACAGGPGTTSQPADRQTASAPPQSQATARTTPPARPATPATPKLALADLIGLPPAQIDTRIGAPDLVRLEGDGEFRIYRNTACVLHVFAYPRDGVRRATHVEARSSDGRITGAQADACVAAFAKS